MSQKPIIVLKDRGAKVDVYATTGITPGEKISIQNVTMGRTVKVYEGSAAPTGSNEFRVLEYGHEPVTISSSNHVWVWSDVPGASISVWDYS